MNEHTQSTTTLTSEFQVFGETRRITVELGKGLVTFENCHFRRPEPFRWWHALYQPNRSLAKDTYYECPLNDVLDVEIISFRDSIFRVVTSKGNATVYGGTWLRRATNYKAMKSLLSRIAKTTPPPPFWASQKAAHLLLGVIIAIIAAAQIVYFHLRN